jgi:hypothetical protein
MFRVKECFSFRVTLVMESELKTAISAIVESFQRPQQTEVRSEAMLAILPFGGGQSIRPAKFRRS